MRNAAPGEAAAPQGSATPSMPNCALPLLPGPQALPFTGGEGTSLVGLWV